MARHATVGEGASAARTSGGWGSSAKGKWGRAVCTGAHAAWRTTSTANAMNAAHPTVKTTVRAMSQLKPLM